MASVYDEDNFIGRVNHAAAVISRNGNETRHFDTCFEMFDGEAVAAALARRAGNNSRLAANLSRYLDKTQAEAAARKWEGRRLCEVARELRERKKGR